MKQIEKITPYNKSNSSCEMRESLDNKIIVIEFAGQSILLSNSDDNFKKELIAMGFVKKRKYYALDLSTKDITQRVTLIKKLIPLEALLRISGLLQRNRIN